MINSTEAISEVFVKQPYAFAKPAFLKKFLGPIIGLKGLFFTEVQDEHLGARRRLSRPFGIANLKRLVGVFREKARDLAGVLDRYVDGGAEEEKSGVAIDGEFSRNIGEAQDAN